MKKFFAIAGGVVLFVGTFTVLCYACDWVFPGRMTGGGSIFTSDNLEVKVNGGTDDLRVTHGFEIHCGDGDAIPPGPNNLEINWPSEVGAQNRFHLQNLVYGFCDTIGDEKPPAAGFNRFHGKGCGTLNGAPGAFIEFEFTDFGEPGTKDTESVTINTIANLDCTAPSVAPAGETVLNYSWKYLTFGNQQAHKDNR